MAMAVIFIDIMYIGKKKFKRDSFYGTGRTFVPFIPQPVDVAVAQRMAAEAPEVYMITKDAQGNPTVDYLEFLVNGNQKEFAEKLVTESSLETTLDALLKDANLLHNQADTLGVEVLVTNVNQQKASEIQKQQDEFLAFKTDINKAQSKKVLVKMVKDSLGIELKESTERAELESQALAEYKKQRGIVE